ncbi:MAG: right-handed parallel beta-helix repeat-containing protein, partial [Bacteroidales bacterium]|nr:right-handed parallel beta-helix repeat-containing protein [Bacteroidales bacterium]
MKYNKAIYIAVFVILCTFWGNTQVLPQVPQKIFYVSPSGNDNNPGTIHKTLASFQGAKEAVLAYKKDHPNTSIKVYFRAGKYYNKESVIFHARDGGTKAAPIEYAAYPNETPLIIGGKKLNLKWEVYKNGIYKANTPKGLVFESLYVNDQEQVLARYPNYDPSIRIFNGTAADCISPNKVMEWDDPKDGYFHVIHKSLWGGFHYKITGKDDKGKLSMEGGWQNNRPENGLHPELRFVENIFEELDTINEWYLDRAKNTLYYKPDNKLDIYNANIEVAYLDNFIQLKGSHENPVKYLTFSGFHFNRSTRTFMECKEVLLRSDWTIFRGGSILFEGSENCQIKNCEFSQIGSNAIFINSYNRNVLIQTCHIHDIGASAICLVGDTSAVYNPKFIPYGPPVSNEELDLTAGPKNKLYPSHCVINNNLIHDFGTIEKQVSGVEISIAAYITISQNSIYDCPRSGINISEGAFGGHIIEFNDVFNTVLETGDHGSFNSWGRDRFWMASNEKTEERVENNRATILLDILASTIIRNNRLRCDHGWDIDLDDGSSYYHIYNNLCLANGIKLREGYYRRVENNICINNSIHPHVWLKNNHDIVRGNIFGSQLYPIKINDWG